MDTTQKNREETAQPRSYPVRQVVELPVSAQQNNGAVRTAEEQRSRAAAVQQASPQTEREQPAAPVKKKPEARSPEAAPAKKRPAPDKKREAPAKKREVPARKRKTPGKKLEASRKKLEGPEKKPAPKKKRPAVKAEPDDISTKKRAYGNSKPKKTLFKKSGESDAEQTKSSRAKKPAPAVIYTQPQAFNRNRLMMQLITVTAVVVALVLGVSVFFKVEQVTVSGAEVYSDWSIRDASGIVEGDNLLTFSHARAAAQIKAKLAYVDTVRFGIKLPGTVNIIVEEDEVVYAIKDANGQWWLMNSDGRVVEMANATRASSHTQILGVALEEPVPDQKGVAVEVIPVETDAEGETTPAVVTVTGAQRLNAALKILKALEENDIVGEAASVDVTRLEDIILWYGSRYQVNLGDDNRLDYKIACMNDVILQMSDYQSGILDISFTIWPNQVGYTPFA